MRSFLKLFDTAVGDVTLNSPQAAAIGTSFGNGAAQAGQNAANSLQVGGSGNLGLIVNNPAVAPGTTGSDIVVGFFTIAAGGFDIAGRQVDIAAVFTHAANVNAVTYKIQVTQTLPVVNSAISGGTAIASAANSTSGATASLGASIAKYGIAGSNTQLAVHEAAQVGTAVTALTAPTALTLSESLPIYVAMTINCGTTATDGALSFAQLTASN